MSKRSLIVGITGQDGSYLADFLLSKDYEVFGLIRRTSTVSTERIEHILDKITLITGDVTDQSSLIRALNISNPDEVYNFAAQSFVHTSWFQPLSTGDITALGVLRLLEAIKEYDKNRHIRMYQASSSEMFGSTTEVPQKETTPFHPRSPYAVAKVYGHYITVNYKESYDMFNCSGICFNHESPRRGIEFVTRKISNGVARIKLGLDKELCLGDLEAERDWGFAGDYVEAMWLMLQQPNPDNFCVGTGECHSVRGFCELAFNCVGLDYRDYVKTASKWLRPADISMLRADITKIKSIGWKPKVSFNNLVNMMVESDLRGLKL